VWSGSFAFPDLAFERAESAVERSHTNTLAKIERRPTMERDSDALHTLGGRSPVHDVNRERGFLRQWRGRVYPASKSLGAKIDNLPLRALAGVANRLILRALEGDANEFSRGHSSPRQFRGAHLASNGGADELLDKIPPRLVGN
jgi:hypothetical protein